jgi:hypothetical protein
MFSETSARQPITTRFHNSGMDTTLVLNSLMRAANITRTKKYGISDDTVKKTVATL